MLNDGYELVGAVWDIDGAERKGLKIDYEFIEDKRYTVRVRYQFAIQGTEDMAEITEEIIIEGKTSDLVASMEVLPE